jgi:HEPN domain-containing protein
MEWQKRMAERSADWLRQAESDLVHARHASDHADYDWAAFAAHQTAEKAIKGLLQSLHIDASGHVLSILLASLPEDARPEDSLLDRAKELDKHYMLARDPNLFERGAPTDFYTFREAESAIANGRAIVDFCRAQFG